jgi:CubicO group peptidase (beta-lactamase class C family)
VNAVDLMRSRGAPAQLCVIRRGEVVLDEAYRCDPGGLFWIFSASKPFVALLVHLLAQRGALSLSDPVAKHWPGFGQRGKESVTIRQVLAHRAGVPVARGRVGDVRAMADWPRAVREVEAARPVYAPGSVPAYHYLTYGTILGRLVELVSSSPLRTFLGDNILEPLGLHDTYLGLPEQRWPDRVPVRGAGPGGWLTASVVNSRTVRTAPIPGAGISTTARDLARFYDVLLSGGRGVWEPETLAAARVPSSDGEVDRFVRLPIRWSYGFQLGGTGRPMGRLSSPETFGHNGSNCCIGWADPTRGLAFAYLTGRIDVGAPGAVHLGQVADAVLASAT